MTGKTRTVSETYTIFFMNFRSRSPGVRKIQVSSTFRFIPKYQTFKNVSNAFIFCYKVYKNGESCDEMILFLYCPLKYVCLYVNGNVFKTHQLLRAIHNKFFSVFAFSRKVSSEWKYYCRQSVTENTYPQCSSWEILIFILPFRFHTKNRWIISFLSFSLPRSL